MNGVLTAHRVNDEEHLVGVGDLPDVRCLSHQLLINPQSTRGVNNDHIVGLITRVFHARLGDLHRVPHTIAGF